MTTFVREASNSCARNRRQQKRAIEWFFYLVLDYRHGALVWDGELIYRADINCESPFGQVRFWNDERCACPRRRQVGVNNAMTDELVHNLFYERTPGREVVAQFHTYRVSVWCELNVQRIYLERCG